MAGLTLITGGPGTGKTARLIDIAAAHSATDPFAPLLVIVPTVRHADQFRRRLVTRTSVAFGLDVTTFGQFAARHMPARVIPPSEVAAELLGRVTRDRVDGSGAAARFRPIAGTPGLDAFVSTAVNDLIADAVDPATFSDAALRTADPDLHALADIYEAYSAALQAHGWSHPRESFRLVASVLREQHLPTSPLLVDGMQFLRAGEVELIAAAASNVDVSLTIDPSAGARSVWSVEAVTRAVPEVRRETLDTQTRASHTEAFTAADTEAQLREIARSIKDRLTSNAALRPSDFAVTFRQVSPHLALARRVFAESRLPLDPAAGERLAERPFGAWALGLLRLGMHGWRTRDVSSALAAGFADWGRWGLRPGDLDLLRRTARQHQLWSGLDALRAVPAAVEQEIAKRPSADPQRHRDAAIAWSAAVESLAATLETEVQRTPGEHARLVDDALFGAQGWVRAEVDDYPMLGVEAGALRAELAGLRAVDDALGATPVHFDTFLTSLEARMQRPSTLIREAGGVLLAPMHTLHGLRFAHLYVAGLAEGEFPAPQRAGALLDREARDALSNAGLQLPPEPRAAEDELWNTATTRADIGTSLWRPRLNGGSRPVAASYYFEAAGVPITDITSAPVPERAASTRELAIALASGWPRETRRPTGLPAWGHVVRIAAPVEQRRRSFVSAGPYEGDIPGADVDWLIAPDREWSPTRLDSYRTCPFQFFAGYALGLYELDEEREQADAATRGTVIHEMLDQAIRPLIGRGAPLNSETAGEVIEHLRTHGRVIWDSAPARHAFGRTALWRYEWEQTIDQIESLVRREAAQSEALGLTSVAGGEQQFSTLLPGVDPPMRIGGRVDRIDYGPQLIQIVDYKTGRPIERREVASGRLLQLQLYAIAARENLPEARLVARYAFLRPPREEWALDSADSADATIIEEAVRVAADVRDQIGTGAFAVSPQVPVCPTYCSFIHVCRVNSFSRSKSWD